MTTYNIAPADMDIGFESAADTLSVKFSLTVGDMDMGTECAVTPAFASSSIPSASTEIGVEIGAASLTAAWHLSVEDVDLLTETQTIADQRGIRIETADAADTLEITN